MNKIAIIIISGLLISGIVFVLLTQKPKIPVSIPASVTNNAPPTDSSSSSVQLKTYTNPSGFSFQYPKSLLLTEKTVTDQSIYAWVELTDPQKKGVVSVKLESSDLTKIDDWVGVGKMKKVKLADLEGRVFMGENKIVTVALDQGGVLITITTDSLLPAYQKIISSFIFVEQPAQTTTGTSGGGEEDIVFEGEEIIE